MRRSAVDPSREILEQVATRKALSQRSLARDAGIALGLANLLIRRMVRQGWVRMVRVRPNRVAYRITPAGLAERERRSRAHLAGTVAQYVHARDRIAQRFAELSSAWPAPGTGAPGKRIVFCGAGEVAEIGYVCLQRTDLQLVGVVGDGGGREFFGLSVQPYEALQPDVLADVPFGIVVVMSFGDRRRIRQRLSATGVPFSRVFWI
jgi:DNA-binding MarR family transcriptional regulator